MLNCENESVFRRTLRLTFTKYTSTDSIQQLRFFNDDPFVIRCVLSAIFFSALHKGNLKTS